MSRTLGRLALLLALPAAFAWGAPACAQAPDDAPGEGAPEDAEGAPGDAAGDDEAAPGGGDEAAPGDDGDAPEPARAEGDGAGDDADALPAEHVPALTLEVDTGDGVRTGDLVRVTITAVVPDGDDVAVPEQGFGVFELHAHQYDDQPMGDGRRRFTFRLELLALEPGEHELPALRLRVVTADGRVGSARTEPRTITVGSHLANEPDAQLRPPTAPVPVFEKDYTLAWVLGILAALLLTALIAFFVGRWWRRRPKPAKPAPPPRPPWDVALERLEAIRRERGVMLAEGRQGELVDRVSDVVREYLGQRFDFNGLESTSDEVIARLRKVKLRRVALDDVRNLLADSDLVKFARAIPDAAQCERMLEAAVAIVRGTTPEAGARRSVPPKTAKRASRAPEASAGADTAATAGADTAATAGADTAATAGADTDDGDPVATTGRAARALDEAPPEAQTTTDPPRSAGPITLPVEAATTEDARREVGAAVGGAVRDLSTREGFDGTIRVTLGAELPRADETDRALREIHDTLASELDALRTSDGGPVSLVLEHRHDADADGPVTVVDDDGLRVVAPREASARESLPEVAVPPAPGQLRVTGQAAPDALARVLPVFFVNEPGLGQPLLRWVNGIPLPVAYRLETEEGPVLFATDALRGLRVGRSELHDRALANLARQVPGGFAPTDEPAWLDGGAAALLCLPSLVPHGAAWLAYPEPDGALVVLREDAPGTAEELARLATERGDAPLFDRPVRVTRGGFAPAEWPADVRDRRTDPGFSDPRGGA
ncbi:MAG: hypothetical protein KF729_21840 [Sandaracinaceae bacterium]|nr:hypothetical protein [Sandaracinaceae bacterium]